MCCSRKTKSKFSFSFPARSEISFEGRPETSLWPPLPGRRSPFLCAVGSEMPRCGRGIVLGPQRESLPPSPQEDLHRERSLVGSKRFLSMATQRSFSMVPDLQQTVFLWPQRQISLWPQKEISNRTGKKNKKFRAKKKREKASTQVSEKVCFAKNVLGRLKTLVFRKESAKKIGACGGLLVFKTF